MRLSAVPDVWPDVLLRFSLLRTCCALSFSALQAFRSSPFGTFVHQSRNKQASSLELQWRGGCAAAAVCSSVLSSLVRCSPLCPAAAPLLSLLFSSSSLFRSEFNMSFSSIQDAFKLAYSRRPTVALGGAAPAARSPRSFGADILQDIGNDPRSEREVVDALVQRLATAPEEEFIRMFTTMQADIARSQTKVAASKTLQDRRLNAAKPPAYRKFICIDVDTEDSEPEEPEEEAYHPIRDDSLRPPPPDKSQPDVYIVERIIDKRVSAAGRVFLVKWFGYPANEATWIAEQNMDGCEDALTHFLAQRDAERTKPQQHRVRHAHAKRKNDDDEADSDEASSDAAKRPRRARSVRGRHDSSDDDDE